MAREFADRGIELSRSRQPAHEAQFAALAGGDPTRGEDEVECVFGAHRSDQRNGDHVWPESDIDLGGSEDGLLGGDDEVAREGQAEAPGESVALDSCDRRLAELIHLREERGEVAPSGVGLLRVGAASNPSEVGTGAECLIARSGENHHANVPVPVGPAKAVEELGEGVE